MFEASYVFGRIEFDGTRLTALEMIFGLLLIKPFIVPLFYIDPSVGVNNVNLMTVSL